MDEEEDLVGGPRRGETRINFMDTKVRRNGGGGEEEGYDAVQMGW